LLNKTLVEDGVSALLDSGHEGIYTLTVGKIDEVLGQME
jgi:hypothetical protein